MAKTQATIHIDQIREYLDKADSLMIPLQNALGILDKEIDNGMSDRGMEFADLIEAIDKAQIASSKVVRLTL